MRLTFMTKLPKAEHDAPEWQAVIVRDHSTSALITACHSGVVVLGFPQRRHEGQPHGSREAR